MSNQNLVAVRYIGSKDVKTDNVSDSGAVWHGNGDVQHVTHAQWGKLSVHKQVWERADTPAQANLTLADGADTGEQGDASGDQQEGEPAQLQTQANDAAPAAAPVKATAKKGAK